MPELMPRLPLDQIHGGQVFRACTINGKYRVRNDPLTEEDLAAIRPTNLRALIDQRYIQVWRRNADDHPPTPEAEGEVMVVPRAGAAGRYDVIVGRRLNGPAALTKNEAEGLAKRVSDSRPKTEEPAAA